MILIEERYDDSDINGLMINYFEKNISVLSQKLANDIKKEIKIKYKIGESFETVKSYYPEKRKELKGDSLYHNNLLMVNTLEHYLKAARREQYFSLLNKLLEMPEEQIDKNFIMDLFYSILMVLLTYINSRKLTEIIAQRISLYHLTQADEYRNPSETAEYIRNLSEVIFDSINEQEKLHAKKIVGMLINYINQNLHEDLSLVRLSEEAHYNPTYLSRLFKQESGVNLSDFILNSRIDKAKELLAENKLKINRIAKEVGYESSHSFARTFKNITGVSPLDYRNSKL